LVMGRRPPESGCPQAQDPRRRGRRALSGSPPGAPPLTPRGASSIIPRSRPGSRPELTTSGLKL
ncbi:MAG: hypothetical protein MZV64_33440, partial [Ignavibacteriales bacterium]|nr:hypothetical protein [Ignavibacteriales bacterium]